MTSTVFNFAFLDLILNNVCLSMAGDFQAENCTLALAITQVLSQKYNFKLNRTTLLSCLTSAHFLGRFDIKQINNQTIILDGAHNQQKMTTLLKSLNLLFPKQKYNFLLAFKKGRDIHQMLKLITPHADQIIVTNFFKDPKNPDFSEEPKIITRYLEKVNFKNFRIYDNQQRSLDYVATLVNKPLVITGSLYLLSEIYLTKLFGGQSLIIKTPGI
jgi:dihydrofolate synthase/folylpolyglutamate synthase